MFDPRKQLKEVEPVLIQKHPEIISITYGLRGSADYYTVLVRNSVTDDELSQLQADLYDDFRVIYDPEGIDVESPHLLNLVREN